MITEQIKGARAMRSRQDSEPKRAEYARADRRAARRFSVSAATARVTARPTPEVARVRAKE